jgi:hypothetical protein
MTAKKTANGTSPSRMLILRLLSLACAPFYE